MGKRKKAKDQTSNPDYEQLKENLRFIQDEIEQAERSSQRKQLARLKLKMLVLKLRYNATQLQKTALAAQDLKAERSGKQQ